MLILFVIAVISFILFVILYLLTKKVKRKYKSVFHKMMAICIVVFIIGTVNLNLKLINKDFTQEEIKNTQEEEINSLNEEAEMYLIPIDKLSNKTSLNLCEKYQEYLIKIK